MKASNFKLDLETNGTLPASEPSDRQSADQSKISVQSVLLPSGGGAITGMGESFQEQTFTGAATFSIPIRVTESRDFEPELNLTYNSAMGNGPFGLGFSLPLSSVSRRTLPAIPQYRDSDGFTMNEYGTLVAVDGSTTRRVLDSVTYSVTRYQPRLEQTFDRIEYWKDGISGTSFWQIINREDVTRWYGRTPQARITNPAIPSQIFQWLLEEEFDPRGNARLYQYKAENTEGVADAIYEQNRTQTANKYIEKIRYGNQTPFQPGGIISDTDWHFEVVFDYGEYNIDPSNDDPYKPARPWLSRPDSFSLYDAGFELRTHRLCRNVLLFHHFAAEFGPHPILVRATRLSYAEDPSATTLSAVTLTGYQYQTGNPAEQPYKTKSLPAVELEYVPFTPGGQEFKPLTVVGGAPPPVVEQFPDYSIVDLYGEGIPGILYADSQTVMYWSPELAGFGPNPQTEYTRPVNVVRFPVERSGAGTNLMLIDLDADGRMEMVKSSPTQAGFYLVEQDGGWKDFRPFESFPTTFAEPFNEFADITGDGRPDVVAISQSWVSYNESWAEKGYGPQIKRLRESGVPPSRDGGATQRGFMGFADMLGSGKLHRVRVTSGRVECWPNLGYGRFGEKIELGNAPHFGSAGRGADIFLADLDGSGTTDLVLAFSDRVEVYFNRSGNFFEPEPVVVRLKATCASPDQITFADVYGTGCQCLVFTEPFAPPRHWAYDFSGGVKPRMLRRISNNLGSSTNIRYASSTRYYLEDKRDGNPWITRLPFPMQVVERVEHHDAISQKTVVTSYTYHQGYYDPVEREFRGFGMVERAKLEFQDGGDSHRSEPPASPVRDKSWYYTGAWQEQSALMNAYRKEFFAGDPDAYPMPGPHFDWNGFEPNAETIRQAHTALSGFLLREEIYGRDGSPSEDAPFTVAENNYAVRLLQPAGAEQYAVFFVHARETIEYDYERQPLDPRMSHSLTLEVDTYGDVVRSCSVIYPRRRGDEREFPQQFKLWVRCVESRYMAPLDGPDELLLGVPAANRSFEITGLPPPDLLGRYFSFAQIATALRQALGPPHPPEEGPTATLLNWQRYTWAESIPDRIAPQALLLRVDTASFEDEFIAGVFEGVLTGPDLDKLLTEKGGYYPDQENYYWWRSSLKESYFGPEDFFLPKSTATPFGQPATLRSGSVTTYEYDPYKLLLVSTVTRGTATDVLEARNLLAQIDYRTMHARQLTDENGIVSESIQDPLGNVIATTHYGDEFTDGQKKRTGFTPFSFATADDWPEPSSLDDVIARPALFLRGAAEFFYYDLLAWVNDGSPARVVGLEAQEYPRPDSPNEPIGEIEIDIEFGDASGRPLQSTVKVEAGDAILCDNQGVPIIGPDGKITIGWTEHRWRTSARVRYNDDGSPFKQYEPYFISTYKFINNDELDKFGVSVEYVYDALNRVISTHHPQGDFKDAFFTRIDYAPWAMTNYDLDDTIKSSNYYRYYITEQHGGISEYERQALIKAAAFDHTPSTQVLDGFGRVIASVARLAGEQPESSLITRYELDIDGSVLWNADPRLFALGVKNFEMIYDLNGNALKTVIADSGAHYRIKDILGQEIYARDARATVIHSEYDSFQRCVSIWAEGGDGPTSLNQVVERFIYGDSLDEQGNTVFSVAEGRNLRGQVCVNYDQAGRADAPAFSIRGEPLFSQRWLWKDYHVQVNWNADLALGWRQLFEQLDVHLETEQFTVANDFDALGRTKRLTDSAGNKQEFSFHISGYLNTLTLVPRGAGPRRYVTGVSYDPKGQRKQIQYGGADGSPFLVTDYLYDPYNFRLMKIKTNGLTPLRTFQDLTYFYDPEGNITHVQDGAAPLPRVVFRQQEVTPDQDFTYDALYRLIQAEGRAHTGLTQRDEQLGGYEQFFPPQRDPHALENYTAFYTYDEGGNLYVIRYVAVSNSWTRTLVRSQTSNRAAEVAEDGRGPGALEGYFDANGNQIKMDGMGEIAWDYRNNIQSVTIIDRSRSGLASDAEYYQYSGAGVRLRKVAEVMSLGATIIEETIYLGQLEIHRKRTEAVLGEEYHRIRIMDDDKCIAERLHWVVGTPPEGVQNGQSRYQLDNNLGSSTLELDEMARVVSYEEYAPYGSTTYALGDSLAEVSLKQRRYSAKIRDQRTGLYYYGARYYAPWLGRWMSTDPAGAIDGLNLYEFVSNNPIRFVDLTGLVKFNKVKLSKLPPPRTATTARTKALWAKKITKLVSEFGDKPVSHYDPPTGRREIDFTEYAFQLTPSAPKKGVVKAIVSLKTFGKGSTRSQHFSFADKALGIRLGRAFRRKDMLRGQYKKNMKGTWHHHPTVKEMAFVPTELHSQIGHQGGIKKLF